MRTVNVKSEKLPFCPSLSMLDLKCLNRHWLQKKDPFHHKSKSIYQKPPPSPRESLPGFTQMHLSSASSPPPTLLTFTNGAKSEGKMSISGIKENLSAFSAKEKSKGTSFAVVPSPDCCVLKQNQTAVEVMEQQKLPSFGPSLAKYQNMNLRENKVMMCIPDGWHKNHARYRTHALNIILKL
ncbi:PAS domain S-box protein [Striga asiatica]|uniref:PAS domain S-box protein n=1 Tax=Striga asiatica TaxID=4170 RepID=A0A5A7QQK5_STRAF|nr:PAS domain S-box protein [Striga asiatica]